MFIPNYYVRFGFEKLKPLGIGYADLPTVKAAESVIQELDGSFFKDRKLNVRAHVPFNPSPRFSRFRSSETDKKELKPQLDAEPEQAEPAEVPKNVEFQPTRTRSWVAREKPKYSDSTLFIKGIKHKPTELSLMEFFQEFNPVQVKLAKSRGFINGFRPSINIALVTFESSDTLDLDMIIETCRSRLFEGSRLSIGKAFARSDKFATSSPPSSANPEPIVDTELHEEKEVQPESTEKVPKANQADEGATNGSNGSNGDRNEDANEKPKGNASVNKPGDKPSE